MSHTRSDLSVQPYRQILTVPGVKSQLLLAFLGRLPVVVWGIVATLHIVLDRHLGYGAAGLVSAAIMIGNAVGSPFVGRKIDIYGLRPVVLICGLTSSAFWISATELPYWILVLLAFPTGLLALPVGSINRQVLTALVPIEQRRTAYSLDSIVLELSFMSGLALATLTATQLSPGVTLTAVGFAFLVVTVILYWQNPPVRSKAELASHTEEVARTPAKPWLTTSLIAALVVGVGTGFCMSGNQVSMVAALNAINQVGWSGAVVAAICTASVTGGIVHGLLRRSASQTTLFIAMSGLIIPIGFATGSWWTLALALIPCNLCCAPTLAATTERVGSLVPSGKRGEAMGYLDSSTRIGLMLGTPLVGFAIDHTSAAWGYTATGVGGLALALVSLSLRKSQSSYQAELAKNAA